MTEAEKIALSEPLAEIFMSMEDDLLRAIAKQIAEGGEINASSEWRLLKLAQEGALTAEAVRIIKKYLGSQDEELTRAIAAAALGVIDTLEPAFQQCALDGFVSDASEIPMSAMSAKIISTYRKQAATDLNLVNTVMMYKTGSRYKELVNRIYDEANRQDYLNILGKHTASVVTGAEARQKAVSSCIREFADKGIPAFVDKAGREWSPEAYINMDIRTTVSNTANAAQDAVCDRYGVDLIEVSSHMGARPKCAPYQGKIFSRSNQSGIAHDGNGREIRYEPLSSTSYGQPDGLFGINCRHQKYPFVDGVNFQTYFPYDEAENAKRYKEFQTQRAMERDIRKKKRECMMLEETGDTEALKAARTDLRQSKKAYNAYSDEHGLRTREDRLRVERSSGKGAADRSSAKPVLPGGSGGHAVEVGVWGYDNGGFGELYRGAGLTNGGGNGIIKTREQTKAIIAKAQEQIRPIFAVDDEVRGAFATNVSHVIPKEGFYDVALHGSPENVEFFGETIDAKTLAKIIKSRKDYPKGSKIRLLSCSTGKITDTANCFAQQLANALGVEIEAPTDDIFVYSNGDFIIGKKNNGEMKIFYPRE